MALANAAAELNGFTVREVFLLGDGGQPLMVGYNLFDPEGRPVACYAPDALEKAMDDLTSQAWSRTSSGAAAG